jgi:hypothetical protein
MSFFEHARQKIFNNSQHPLVHDISDFGYLNTRLPGISRLNDAIDWIVASIYPNYIATVANPAALPLTGNANDYYIVTDDGDGKSAGYVWTVTDNAGQWVKRYDVDWSMENILAEAVNRTMPMYVHKYGMDDRDASGITLAGVLSGQHIYGGSSANTHLTLHANAGDIGGGHTGYIQVDDHVRPVTDSLHTLGTNAERWLAVYTDSLTSGTLTATSGSITDSSGAIDFGAANLGTTGSVSAGTLSVTTSGTISTLSFATGSITDSTGTINFGNELLVTTGTVTAASGSHFGDLTLADGSITSASGTIDFGNENLTTTGSLSAGVGTLTRLNVDDLRVDGNTLSVVTTDTNLNLLANGTGVVAIGSPMTTGSQTVTGTIAIAGQLDIDNLRLDLNTISSTNLNGNVILAPNGAGLVELGAGAFPTTDSTVDLGKSGNVWNKLWIDGAIGGATEITLSDLLTLRSTPYRDSARTTPAQAGDTLFWNGSQWLANHPDTEITHSELTGLTTGDAGHTQFALLAGRSGGQVLKGGTAASETLVLESTAHASKGTIQTKDNFLPFTDASYSGSWSGTNWVALRTTSMTSTQRVFIRDYDLRVTLQQAYRLLLQVQ